MSDSNNKTNISKKDAVVCVCCLAFYPVLYLVGSTIMAWIG